MQRGKTEEEKKKKKAKEKEAKTWQVPPKTVPGCLKQTVEPHFKTSGVFIPPPLLSGGWTKYKYKVTQRLLKTDSIISS